MNEPGTGRPIVKHTPGPWHAWNDDVWGWGVGSEDYTICEELSEADARLIASAPDLLEALRSFIDPDNAPLVLSDSHSLALMDKARAAIAKATGTAGERP